MACEELERLVHAYAARVQAFYATIGSIETTIPEWYARCEQQMTECRHAQTAIMKHAREHGCVSMRFERSIPG